MGSRTASGSTVVAAPPAEVFAVVADPRRHAEIDGSGTLRGVVDAPDRLELGSRFSMAMQMGVRYTVTNRVVEFEPDRRIGWRHIGLHRWRYDLEPAGIGTRVTETWDGTRYPAAAFLVVRAMGFPGRAERGIQGTLQQLEEHFGRG
jgi:uncharacterized protein YndB with AHSA1/START domain